jgi:chemotaxis protein MotB
MRRRAPNHSHADRWVLPYADFVTLLFALFVAMYAMAQQDRNGAKRFSASVREAVKTGGVPTAIRSLMASHDGSRPSHAPVATESAAKSPPVSGDTSLEQPFLKLSGALMSEIDSGKVELHLGKRGLVVTLQQQSFFPSGDDTIFEASYPALARVATVIAGLPNPVQLEGHTDSVPIHTSRFRNNWELSTARSIALLELFQTKFGLDPARFTVAGYAQNAPVASNDTEAGRARNRRVEIVILSP